MVPCMYVCMFKLPIYPKKNVYFENFGLCSSKVNLVINEPRGNGNCMDLVHW